MSTQLPSRGYGTIGQINALIGNALLDYLYLCYQTEGITCNYGEIADGPYEGHQGLQMKCGIASINPLMARNFELFLDKVGKDPLAQKYNVNIFHDNRQEQRLVVYADPREMMGYLYDLYQDAGIRCDFTRFYHQTAEALKPRKDDYAFYLN